MRLLPKPKSTKKKSKLNLLFFTFALYFRVDTTAIVLTVEVVFFGKLAGALVAVLLFEVGE